MAQDRPRYGERPTRDKDTVGGEPIPDYTTLARHLQTIPQDWPDMILTKTATPRMDEAGSATGPLGADSSGVETTRYTAE